MFAASNHSCCGRMGSRSVSSEDGCSDGSNVRHRLGYRVKPQVRRISDIQRAGIIPRPSGRKASACLGNVFVRRSIDTECSGGSLFPASLRHGVAANDPFSAIVGAR